MTYKVLSSFTQNNFIYIEFDLIVVIDGEVLKAQFNIYKYVKTNETTRPLKFKHHLFNKNQKKSNPRVLLKSTGLRH